MIWFTVLPLTNLKVIYWVHLFHVVWLVEYTLVLLKTKTKSCEKIDERMHRKNEILSHFIFAQIRNLFLFFSICTIWDISILHIIRILSQRTKLLENRNYKYKLLWRCLERKIPNEAQHTFKTIYVVNIFCWKAFPVRYLKRLSTLRYQPTCVYEVRAISKIWEYRLFQIFDSKHDKLRMKRNRFWQF